MKRAQSSFEVTGWNETTYREAENRPKLSRAEVSKEFTGPLEGSSKAEILLCMSDPDDYRLGAGYIGSEEFTGKLDGLSGSFVFQHGGISGPDGDRTFGTIIPGSGRDQLQGVSGTIEISREDDGRHFITVDYEISPD